MEFTWYIVTHFLKSIIALQQILHGALCYTNTWLLIAVLGRVPCLRTGLRSDLFEDQVPGVFVLKGNAKGSQMGRFEWDREVRDRFRCTAFSYGSQGPVCIDKFASLLSVLVSLPSSNDRWLF